MKAYEFKLNHEGAHVGSIYYALSYFNRKGIINPTSGKEYTEDEIKSIKDNSSNYIDAKDGALLGINPLNTDIIYWYDTENANRILASSAPLIIDKENGNMKDASGSIVAGAIK